MRGLKSLLFLYLICVAGLLPAQQLQLMRPSQRYFLPATVKNDTKLVELMQMLRFYYVDSIDDKELVNKAITALLQELDPHSYYIPKEQSEDAMSELLGHFFGVGIEFSLQRDTLVVMSTIPDAPAERVGIRAGDKFLTVNGEKITNIKLTNSKVAKYLRGPRGSSVTLDVLRNKQVAKYTVIRDSVPLHSVDVAYLIRPKIGYIRVTRFAEPTVAEFAWALEQLAFKGATSFIVDLRGNGGGLMQGAFLMASLFLPPGSMVVYAKGRRTGRQDFEAIETGSKFLNTPLVVLVDENSASASEILAGALQDWDRAVIVGRRTFGRTSFLLQIVRSIALRSLAIIRRVIVLSKHPMRSESGTNIGKNSCRAIRTASFFTATVSIFPIVSSFLRFEPIGLYMEVEALCLISLCR